MPKNVVGIVGFQKFLQLSVATYTSYYCQFYLDCQYIVSTASIVSAVSRSDDEIPPPPQPPPQTPTQQAPHTVSTIKLPILKKEDAEIHSEATIKDIEDSSRPARSILTMKPLLKIDPKDKGKSVLEEPEPAKKMTRSDFDAAQIARDAKIYFHTLPVGTLQAESSFNRRKERISQIEESKVLAETFAAQRKFKAAQRSAEIRKIQGLYERQKRVIDDFKPMDSDDAVKDSKEAAGVHNQKIFRSDGSSRWIKTFSEMVTRFDRLDLVELYNLVMKRFETTTLEGNLKSWDLYENCGVHTLILEDGTEIHMLAERKYPLTKETLERMLSLRLVAGTASEDAYTLLRFIQKQIDEYGSHDGALAIPEQTATGKEISNPFMAGEDCWDCWVQKFLQLSAATYTSYYYQFYLVLLMKNAIDSRK
ncbi:hypothetical protein Tco_0077430 [Tanacetum coccineum]